MMKIRGGDFLRESVPFGETPSGKGIELLFLIDRSQFVRLNYSNGQTVIILTYTPALCGRSLLHYVVEAFFIALKNTPSLY